VLFSDPWSSALVPAQSNARAGQRSGVRSSVRGIASLGHIRSDQIRRVQISAAQRRLLQ